MKRFLNAHRYLPCRCRLTWPVFVLMLSACSQAKNDSWVIKLNNIGTYSSPRLADLNKDGIDDIVLGAGGREELSSDSAVIAVDGANGNLLWSVPGLNQFVGSAIFQDINNDDIPDVLIGGRWAQLVAIDGISGALIWTFYPERKNYDGSDGGWYNFTTPQLIPDQDRDGIQDIVIANGGDARAAPGDTIRPVGRILIISSRTGKILGNAAVPDGKETYMSVACLPAENNDWQVIFGTGGETIGGGLYRTSLSSIIRNDISQAKVIAVTKKKGFVASPVLADINDDGVKDVIINNAEGTMNAFDGRTDSLLWQVGFPGTEAYTVAATGNFTGDATPDFFANFAIGTFPVLTKSIRFMVDGKDGRVRFCDTVPSFQYASAVAADLDGDGYDEVIVNQSAVKRRQFDNAYFCFLSAIDFRRNNRIFSVHDTIAATNFASTPWIGDADQDGQFDIVYTSVVFDDGRLDLAQPLGLYISRFRTNLLTRKFPAWGAFMGSYYDGSYQPKPR